MIGDSIKSHALHWSRLFLVGKLGSKRTLGRPQIIVWKTVAVDAPRDLCPLAVRALS